MNPSLRRTVDPTSLCNQSSRRFVSHHSVRLIAVMLMAVIPVSDPTTRRSPVDPHSSGYDAPVRKATNAEPSGDPRGKAPKGLAASDWGGIMAAYEAGRYAIHSGGEGGHLARNPGQQWLTRFEERGFLVQPEDADWHWGLELTAYGFPGHERSRSSGPVATRVNADGSRLTQTWDAGLRQWFVNDARGLEHGFTVNERPAGSDNLELVFTLAVRGSLHPVVATDESGVRFVDAQGVPIVNYTGLKVWDADGKVLPARFDSLYTRHSPVVTLAVDERGARYPLTIDPIAQQAYLKPAAVGTTQASDGFGGSVAVSGDTVVVGALGEDSSTTGVNSIPNESASSSGAAYVFTRSAGVWTQQAYLKPAAVGTTQASDLFGCAVAVSGDTVVVGAYMEDGSGMGVNSTPDESALASGAAYVFTRSAGVWTQQAYLKPAAVGTTQAGDQFGITVAVSGDTVVVGANQEDSSTTGVNSIPNESGASSGAAYVYTRSAGVWTQQSYLKPAAVGTTQAVDGFGGSVAIADDTVVVGARNEDSSTTGVNTAPNESATESGAAYVFTRSAGVWTQQAYLKPAAVGTTQASDQFGFSVAVAGDAVVVGARFEDSSTTGVNTTPDEGAGSSGAAYVFSRSAGLWTQQAYLKPTAVGTNQAGDSFGFSVAAAGDTVVVGAFGEASSTTGVNTTPNESASLAGAAYVFTGVGPTAAPGVVSGQVLDTNGNPVEGVAMRMGGTQNRLTITDAGGNYRFEDVESNGFYVVTPARANFTFTPSQSSFSQLGLHTQAGFTAMPPGSGLNPLDTTEYFVRQHYLDFLGREPDEAGLNSWVDNIEACGNDAVCREVKRIDTSAAFFLSIEFQQTGYLVYRTYQAAYGDMTNAPVPIQLSEFSPDTKGISNGVVVLQDGWEQKLENNKRAFLTEFVKRARFAAAYPITMTPQEFVDKLFVNAGIPLSDSDHGAAINEFGPATDSADAMARARALRRAAENPVLTRQKSNTAFVLMQYFGYLGRDANAAPDTDFSGYDFWLKKLDAFNGNYVNAEMVESFLVSMEYRGRFPR